MSENMETTEIIRAAYANAWAKFKLIEGLSPDEKMYGADQLRYDIEILVASGERDEEKIATSALCMMREKEQVARSKAKIKNVSGDMDPRAMSVSGPPLPA